MAVRVYFSTFAKYLDRKGPDRKGIMKIVRLLCVVLGLLLSVVSYSQGVDSLQLQQNAILGEDSLLVQADTTHVRTDTIKAGELLQTAESEQALEEMLFRMLQKQGEELARKRAEEEAAEQRRHDSIVQFRIKYDTTTIVPLHLGYLDSIRISERIREQKGVHPLLGELVLRPRNLDTDFVKPLDFGKMYFGKPATSLGVPAQRQPVVRLFADDCEIAVLREEACRQITAAMMDVYTTTFDRLPDPKRFQTRYIQQDKVVLAERSLFDREKMEERQRLRVKKIALRKWVASGNALLQFTQNYISPNWYKGGNSNMAILGILSGSVKYDNKKNVTWENTGEWRAGFNSVSGDTIHLLSTNDDVFKIYSKLGIRAFNDFYYSASAELLTQLFDTYDGMNSTKLKTAFFSPLRFNVAVGMDYKPSSDLSIVLSPLTYKYVYVHDTIRIDQTAFSVEHGKRVLHELGSSVRIEYTWKPLEEISLVSKFYFYTNYKKIETELELVCNFVVNRFLTTRISLYPRYDNTVIMADDEKARLQFKEFISFGFAHSFK